MRFLPSLLVAGIALLATASPASAYNCTQGGPTSAPHCFHSDGAGTTGGTAHTPQRLPGVGAVAGLTEHHGCQEAGWSTAHANYTHGIATQYRYVWAQNPAHGHHPEPMIVACRQESGNVWPGTTGPGADGLSLPCPVIHGYQTRAAGGGAGLSFMYYGYDFASTADFPQISGGFGAHDDGYWHYRTFNGATSRKGLTLWLYGYCRYWGHVHA